MLNLFVKFPSFYPDFLLHATVHTYRPSPFILLVHPDDLNEEAVGASNQYYSTPARFNENSPVGESMKDARLIVRR